MDEFADIDPDAFYETLRPTLSDKEGSALFIGTPKGIGNWAHSLYQMQLENPALWASFSYTTLDGGNVSADEIEQAKRDLDTRTFRQEYMATFETYTGRIFYNFDRTTHVKKWEQAVPDVVYIGMDFNIDPMSAVIMIRQGDCLHVIDEIRMFSSNTQETVEEINSRYPKIKKWVYPDPAARQRKTSAGGATDLTILQNAGYIVKAPNAHNPVRDGINAVNSRLKNDKGIINLFVDPKCKHTIDSLERYSYKEGTSQPDKDAGYDHMMDALRYAVDYMFPIKKDIDPALLVPQRWGHGITA